MGKTSEIIKALRDHGRDQLKSKFEKIFISNRNVFEAVDASMLTKAGTSLIFGRTGELPSVNSGGAGPVATLVTVTITILVALTGRSCEGKKEEERTLLLFDLSDDVINTFKKGVLQADPQNTFAAIELVSVNDQIDVIAGNFIATTLIYNVYVTRV